MGGADNEPTESILVSMGDGTRLATDIYLPRRPSRVPTVLVRTPYGTRGNAVWFGAIGRLFADHGFAFVAQDTRGHHGSDGVPVPFAHEAQDGYDTCDWVVRQPWSDGTIATFGESYVGFTAHRGGVQRSSRDPRGGVACDDLRHPGRLAPASRRPPAGVRRSMGARGLVRSGQPGAGARLDDPTASRCRARGRAGSGAGCPRLVGARRRARTALEPRRRMAGADRPAPGADTLHGRAGGTYSNAGNSATGAITHGAEALVVASSWRRPTTLVMIGATDRRLDPLADFDALAARMPDVLRGELAFLRGQLQGVGDEQRSYARLMDPDARRTTSGELVAAAQAPSHFVCTWWMPVGPIAARREARSHARPDHIPVEARWVHDPRRLVPSMDGEAVEGWFRRPDERLAQVRDDVITFTSEVARVPLDLAGPVTAELVLRASGASGHVTVKLCDVYPTGEAYRIVDGASRLEGDRSAMTDRRPRPYRIPVAAGPPTSPRDRVERFSEVHLVPGHRNRPLGCRPNTFGRDMAPNRPGRLECDAHGDVR